MATQVIFECEWTDAQRSEIAEELERILADPTYGTSHRSVILLRHLVEVALMGDTPRLKERILGMEVFGRDPNYDAYSDPIVRRTASEIRKRLAQYYQDHEGARAVKIRLHRGSYLLQFDFQIQPETAGVLETSELQSFHPIPGTPSSEHPIRAKKLWADPRWIVRATVFLLILCAGFAFSRADFFRSTSYLIWKPFLKANDMPIVCVSDIPPSVYSDAPVSPAPKTAPISIAADKLQTVPGGGISLTRARVRFMDMDAALKIYKQLSQFGGDMVVVRSSSSSINIHKLHNRSIIVIGGLNYPLAQLLNSQLRFSVQIDPVTAATWVQDAQQPSVRAWKFDGKQTERNIDYAVITRFWDADTGGWVMMLTGLRASGTQAAANFLADASSTKLLPARIRKARNFQIVLKATIVDGSPASPQVLDVYTW